MDWLLRWHWPSWPSSGCPIWGRRRASRRCCAPVASGALELPRRPRAGNRVRIGQLTEREQDVLALLAEGLSTSDMADRLVLSPRTVEHHVSAVLPKLGEPTRARAVATARRLGALR